MVITGQINFNPNTEEKFDGGFGGYNWKVRIGSSGPFVLKVFWDQKAPKQPYYFALQRECQNAAVLQLMRAAIAKDDASAGPILVNSGLPWTRDEALRNLLAFPDEKRLENKLRDDTSGKTRVTSMPRTRQCYGWVKIKGHHIRDQVPFKWWHPWIKINKTQRRLHGDQEYIALVYEYIEEGANDRDIIAKSLEFFQSTFYHTSSPLQRSWKQSILVDMSDIIYAGGYGSNYWTQTAHDVLLQF